MVFDREKMAVTGIMASNRRLPKIFEAPVKKFASYVGEAIWAWNYCHAAFSDLFCILVNPQELMIGHAIWHASQSDSTQRDFLFATAKIALAKKPRLLARVEWAKRSADALSTIRNDAVHTATSFAGRLSQLSLTPNILATAPKRFRRMKERDFESMCSKLTGDLIALGGYVRLLSGEVAFPGRFTLPKRPKLQSIQDQPSTKKRRRTHTTHPRPLRSSRG